MSTIEAFKMIENKYPNKCVGKNEPTNFFCIKLIIDFIYDRVKSRAKFKTTQDRAKLGMRALQFTADKGESYHIVSLAAKT
jgi:hypothetical protein